MPLRIFSKICAGLLLICSASSFAHWDYQLGVSGRSVPLGGLFNATVGYNWLLWGENPLPSLPLNGPSEGANVWKYGYIRPSFSIQTVGITNRSVAELDIFPVSIFGVTLGQSYRQKLDQSFQFDCTQVACGGLLSRSYIRGQIVLGAKGFFTVLSTRYEALNHAQATLPFIDENNSLVGSPGSDQLVNFTAGLGYSFNSRWQVGAGSLYSRLLGTGDNNLSHIGYVSHFRDRWNFFLAAGSYASTYQDISPTVIGVIQLMGQRPFGIF